MTVDLRAVSRAEAFALGVAGEVDALWVNDPDGEAGVHRGGARAGARPGHVQRLRPRRPA
ncbi:MAG: hypothetical protein M5R40_22790 [Anaerolineae bacterium]|nr:hypothetical protein [Anaerolineae bacterium]